MLARQNSVSISSKEIIGLLSNLAMKRIAVVMIRDRESVPSVKAKKAIRLLQTYLR